LAFVCFSLLAGWANFTLWTRTDFLLSIAQDVHRIGALIGSLFGEESANGLALILGQAQKAKVVVVVWRN
jgi:hypothetical protein